MVIVTQNSINGIYNRNGYQLDYESDLEELKTKNCAPGSEAFCLETSNIYIKNGSGDWVIPGETSV